MLFCISFVTFISFQFCTNIQELDNRRRCERKKCDRKRWLQLQAKKENKLKEKNNKQQEA